MTLLHLHKVFLAAAFVFLFNGLSQAQETSEDTPSNEELASVAEMLDAIEGIEELFNSCPADLANTRRSISTWMFGYKRKNIYSYCEENISVCGAACFEDLSPNSCFYTARILEDYQGQVSRVAGRKAYAFACAIGSPGGCTNRGANILNAYSDQDAWSTYEAEKQFPCIYKTFAMSCKAGDSWGCAMSGQTYQFGQGVEVNVAIAKGLYERACELASTERFASCEFAKRRIKDMANQTEN